MNHTCELTLAVFLCVAAGLSASAYRHERERERTYHVIHYALDLRIDEVRKSVGGVVTMRLCPLRPIGSVDIDAGPMTVSGVMMSRHGEKPFPAPFHLNPGTLVVTPGRGLAPGDTVSLAISYSATPRTGLFFIGPDSAYPDTPLNIWSQGEMEQNHFWFPCYDYPNDKATVSMRVTVNQSFTAVSNGALLGETHNAKEKTRTFQWYSAKPMSSYLIAVVVGNYVQIADRYKTIPVQYNVFPSERDDALRSFQKTPDMIRFFSEKTGIDYPWAKYAQTVVAGFTYGGMENTSATTLTDRTIHSARAHLDMRSEGLVAHELAHQWFGDLLTCRNWSHAWLNEGFATFFQMLYDESSLGQDEYQQDIGASQREIVRSDTGWDRRPTIRNDSVDPEDMFDNRIYARGACILHMLRAVLGERTFWDGIQHYVDLNQYECVVTDDFRHAMEDIAGRDLTGFFDEWTVRAGYPVFAVTPTFSAGLVHCDLRQTQPVDSLTPYFHMPVGIEVATDSGTVVHIVWIDPVEHQQFDLPCNGMPRDIIFDKGGWILKRLSMTKPASMWIHQLVHGDVAGRKEALSVMQDSIARQDVFDAVSAALRSDPFWGVRQRAAEVLGLAREPETVRALAPAFSDPDARVRAAATATLKNFRTLDVLVALGNLLAHDSSEAVQAEAVASLAAIDSMHAMEYCEKGLAMDSQGDVIRAAAARALGMQNTERSKARLLSLTAYGQRLEVRLAAIDALAANWPMDAVVLGRIEELAQDQPFYTRRRALERLADIGAESSRPLLLTIAQDEPNPLLRREARRALRRLDRAHPR